jgi:hypothetical protein
MDWRVFLIGPMNDDYPGHIERIRDYVVDRLMNVHAYRRCDESVPHRVVMETGSGESTSRVIVITPVEHEVPGSIPANVFHQIDNADLVIADLSGTRPAVVYELAFAHALGIETILVGGNGDKVFYLKQYRFSAFDFQTAGAASPALNNHFDTWLDKRHKVHDAPNPIHEFYGAPLLDISAAGGLAAGYFDNFARPVLGSGVIVERAEVVENRPSLGWLGMKTRRIVETKRPLKGLIVGKPSSLTQEIVEFERELNYALEASLAGEMVRGKSGKLFIELQGEEGIRVPFVCVRDYVIDVPRTMFSMKLSRRLERLSSLDLEPAIDRNMQHILIEYFFYSLMKRIQNSRELKIKLAEKQIEFHVATPAEIAEIIKTGRNDTQAGTK